MFRGLPVDIGSLYKELFSLFKRENEWEVGRKNRGKESDSEP